MTAFPYRFRHRLRVRWGECDMQGIVFNPHYMAYFDVAFTEYWRAAGTRYQDAFAGTELDSFMVAASQHYRGSACYDDELDIFVRTEYIGITSFRLGFSIRRAPDDALVDGTATYVVAHRVSRTPQPVPPRLIVAWEAYETTPPERKLC